MAALIHLYYWFLQVPQLQPEDKEAESAMKNKDCDTISAVTNELGPETTTGIFEIFARKHV